LYRLNRQQRKQLASNLSYHYFKLENNKAGAVVVIGVLDNEYYMGLSYCHPHDVFNKTTGKLLALKDMFGDPNVEFENVNYLLPNNATRRETANYTVNQYKPTWAKNMTFVPRKTQRRK